MGMDVMTDEERLHEVQATMHRVVARLERRGTQVSWAIQATRVDGVVVGRVLDEDHRLGGFPFGAEWRPLMVDPLPGDGGVTDERAAEGDPDEPELWLPSRDLHEHLLALDSLLDEVGTPVDGTLRRVHHGDVRERQGLAVDRWKRDPNGGHHYAVLWDSGHATLDAAWTLEVR